MTVEYLAYQLIAGYGKNKNVTTFLDDYDFYLLPIVNPDGFVYTQTNDRLWRKNRAPPPPGSNNTSDACWGVDLNRNWPHEWIGPGSSNNSCTQTYRGPSPGSEPEMSGMQHFADKLADSNGLKLFIDWHSYSQLILSPYGYSCEAIADTNDEHVDLMAATAEAIKAVEGTEYVSGPTCQTIYATNGGSSDYVYDISGSEWSLAFELRDTGTYGFILPPEQILPNCEEIWAGMQVMLALIE